MHVFLGVSIPVLSATAAFVIACCGYSYVEKLRDDMAAFTFVMIFGITSVLVLLAAVMLYTSPPHVCAALYGAVSFLGPYCVMTALASLYFAGRRARKFGEEFATRAIARRVKRGNSA